MFQNAWGGFRGEVDAEFYWKNRDSGDVDPYIQRFGGHNMNEAEFMGYREIKLDR